MTTFATTHPPKTESHWISLTCAVAAALLIAASILKAAGAIQAQSSLHLLAALQAIGEFLLGCWLISGWRRVIAMRVALVAFGCFAIVAAQKVITRQTDCGCFGTVRTRPSTILLVDLIVVSALAVALVHGRRTQVSHSAPRGRIIGFAAITVLIGICTAGYLAHRAPRTPLNSTGATIPDDILERIDIGERLKRGQWTVLLHRSDCPACKDKLHELLAQTADGSDARSLAVIEVTPDAPLPAVAANVVVGRARSVQGITLNTPLAFHVDDGKVSAISTASSEGLPPSSPIVVQAKLISPGLWLADCGYVEPSGSRQLAYEVQNDSATPIAILAYDIECGCTALREKPALIPPHGKIVLHVDFHAPPEAMVYTKQIVLRTDRPELPQLVLRTSARVGLPLALAPAERELPIGTSESETTFEFENASSSPVRLLYAVTDDADCYLSIPSESVLPRRKVALRCTLLGVKATTGRPRTIAIRLVTSDEQQHVLSVRLKCVAADLENRASRD